MRVLLSIIFSLALLCLGFSFVGINKENLEARAIDSTTAIEAIENGNCVNNGGAIYLAGSSTYTMTGGTLSGHYAINGGAIYVGDGATFTMTGGTISGNYAKYGGAIYVATGGKCYLNGGTIDNCSSTTEGNAIYVEDGGYVEMTDDFAISNSGDNYTYSIKAVNPANVKRPVAVTPYVDGVAQTAISTYSNETISSIGLPTATGCGWYEEAEYTNKVTTTNLVSTYAEAETLSVYFPSHSWTTTERYYGETCQEQGGSEQECSRCAEIQTLSTGGYYGDHVYDYYRASRSVAPTCQSDGYDYWECNWCQDYEIIDLQAERCGFDGTYTDTITAATCVAEGTEGTYCSYCDSLMDTSTIPTDSSNHKDASTTTTTTPATCTTKGSSRTYWACCDTTVSSETIEAWGHEWEYSTSLYHYCWRCKESLQHVFLINADGNSYCPSCGYTKTDSGGNIILFAPSSGLTNGEVTSNEGLSPQTKNEVAYIKEETAYIKEQED